MKRSIGAGTLLCPAPVWVIGTYDTGNRPDIMTASWAGISCSKPPCVSVSLRKATYTYGNIVARKAFTVNVPSEQYMKEADLVGIVSGRDEDKFKRTGLTPVKGDHVDAPYVKEFPMAAECRLLHSFEIGLHTIFVGEILDVKVDAGLLDAGGAVDMEALKPFLFLPGASSYYATGKRLAQAFSIGRAL
jgi:flavin reductase (DIM6/NTAB) family NADH-FMN oxidoreductase RutF